MNCITSTMSHSHSDHDHLLDDDTMIVSNTQVSPGTFTSQVSTRLGIRSFTLRRADAADTNSNNMIVYCVLNIDVLITTQELH